MSEAANARSAGEFAAAEQTHPGWERADYSAARSAYGSFPADCLAALSAYDSLRADLVPDGWVPVECSAEPSPDGSIQAGYSAARAERRCSPDAPRAYWPLAELRHSWPEGYKVLLPLSLVRLRGR